jgi:hypothetical protein
MFKLACLFLENSNRSIEYSIGDLPSLDKVFMLYPLLIIDFIDFISESFIKLKNISDSILYIEYIKDKKSKLLIYS